MYRRGGGGSGGAIKLVADTIAGRGFAEATPGGRVRFEAFDIDPNLNASPTAKRSFAPAAETDPPRLAITAVNGVTMSRVNGAPLSDSPQGVFYGVDVVISGGAPLVVGLESARLASGTRVEVSAKSRVGGELLTAEGTLGSCVPDGRCTATAEFADPPPGTYYVEAKAVFE